MGLNKRLIGAGATEAGGLVPSEHFGVVTYTGNSSTNAITGLSFQPDFVWIKDRSATRDHNITDSTRGVTHPIYIEATTQLTNSTFLQSFDTGGFTLGNQAAANENGEEFVAWCWKAGGGTTSSNTDGTITSTTQVNEQAGFSIIKYTGTGSAATVGHGLNSTPEMIIVKNLAAGENWAVYHSATGVSNVLFLNESNAATSVTNKWAGTNSTVFGINTAGDLNQSGAQLIAYAFHSVDGFSSFGTYTGNASDNGPIVETGFEPAFVMIKGVSGSSATTNWSMFDNKRQTTNPRNQLIWANLNNAETDFSPDTRAVNFYSNGFQPVSDGSDDINDSSTNYIYMAFAADPDTEAPTLADSFGIKAYTGTRTPQSITGLGFQPNLLWIKQLGDTNPHGLWDSIRGAGPYLSSATTDGQLGNAGDLMGSFDTDGFSVNSNYLQYTAHDNTNKDGTNSDYIAWAWKADDNEPTIFGGPALAVYKFEDNVNDVTGDYNATASNISYTSSGKFNKAADFNGTNSYVETSLTANLTSFTWSCWINPDVSWSGDITTIVKGFYSSGTNTNYQYLGYTGGDFRFQFRDNTTTAHVSSSVTPAVGQWSHIVATVDGGTSVKIYINGVLTGSGTNSRTISNTNAVSIGGASSIFGPFNGQIDQVRIYQGAIAQEQVTELYNETVSDNDDLTLGGPPESIVSANANAGFSIVKYTGNGITGTKVPHGLSAAPEVMIIKSLDSSLYWAVYHKYNTGSSGNPQTNRLRLNDSGATATTSIYWNSTAPTATTFTIGTDTDVNTNGDEFIAYCFHSVSGYSKFGGYSGNGSTQSITTGFQVDWLMLKGVTTGSEWVIVDSVRGDAYLLADTNGAEAAYTAVDFLSTGFRLTSTGYNESGRDFIYMAFKIN